MTDCQDQKVNRFERQLRWTHQTAIAKNLIVKGERAAWTLTDKARSKLRNIVRGAIVTLFTTDHGFFLWANCEDAVTVINKGSVSLVYTSPPYPLLRPRAYGNVDEQSWTDWFLVLCEQWLPLLTSSGSLMINLGSCWVRNQPRQSSYIERFQIRAEDEIGLHLLQRLYWHSPAKMSGPLPWVCKERLRVTASLEPILWLSPNTTAQR